MKKPKKTKIQPVEETVLTVPQEEDDLMARLEAAGGWLHDLMAKLPFGLNISRKDALLMHEDIDTGVRLRSVSYWLFVAMSIGIATLGLITNSPAVIIGAMLVSPLMGPIIGLGMSIAVSDFYMGMKSFLILTLSILVAIVTSALITLLSPIREVTPEILGRVNPTLLDLGIAIFSGAVAALSSVRSNGEEILGKAGPGAAIGVALMPPLCVVGFGMGTGFDLDTMWGAFLLFVTNMVAIILVSSLFYYFVYVNYNIKRLVQILSTKREKVDPFYRHVNSVELWGRMTDNLTSWKRFLFPFLLLLAISYPLYSSLAFLKMRSEVRNHIAKYMSTLEGLNLIRGADRLNYGRDVVSGTILYSSAKIPPENFESELSHTIEERFNGYQASVTLVRVAGDSDLSALKESSRAAPLTLETTPLTLHDAVRNKHAAELTQRAEQLIRARFPAKLGFVSNTLVAYSTEGMDRVVVGYFGEKLNRDVRDAMESMFVQELRELKGPLRNVTLEQEGRLKENRFCGKKRNAPGGEELLKGLLRLARAYPNLHVLLQLPEDEGEFIASLAGDAKQIRNLEVKLSKNPYCRISYDLAYEGELTSAAQ